MRKAITTKYLPATNTKGARIKASAEGGNSITLPRDWELDHERDHARTAQALAAKMEWRGLWVAGGLSTGNTYVCAAPSALSAQSLAQQYGMTLGVVDTDWFIVP